MALLDTIGTDLTAEDGTFNLFNNITNDDIGVSYQSLKGEAQLPNLFWDAYGVSDAFGGDFSQYLSSQFAVGLFPGSDIHRGWEGSFNTDGTYNLTNRGGIPGIDYSDFNFGKTAETNYGFYNVINFNNPTNTKTLLDADGDGNNNYVFGLTSDFTTAQLNDSLTIVGQIGANNGGNSITTYEGLFSSSASGNQYALVATDYHPAIPEPASAAGVLGGLALLAAVAYNRVRK